MKIKNTPFFSKQIAIEKEKSYFLYINQKNSKIYIESIERSKMNVYLKISAFFDRIFGFETRNLCKILRSEACKSLIAKNKSKRNNIKQNLELVNNRIAYLNKRLIFAPKIQPLKINALFPRVSFSPSVIKKENEKQKQRSKLPLSNTRRSTTTRRSVTRRGKTATSRRLSKNQVNVTNAPRAQRREQYPLKTLKAFYRNEGVDIHGRSLSYMWRLSYQQKEESHNYIQWLFPLTERSRPNPCAPVLTKEIINELKADPKIIENLKTSYNAMLQFYGFKQKDGKVIKTKSFQQKSKNWLGKGNHNHLRMTRMIKCLRNFGLENEAREFYKKLQQIQRDYPKKVSTETLKIWATAISS